MIDLYSYRSLRKGMQVSDMTDVAVTEQPTAAQAASNTGGFKGWSAAIDPHNPLLWVVILILLLSGIIAASFHLRVTRAVQAAVSV